MPKYKSNVSTLFFVLILCSVSALLLATISELLMDKKEAAQRNYRNHQLLISSRILSYDGYFTLLTENGESKRAQWKDPVLIANPNAAKASDEAIEQICKLRILPRLADREGKTYTFEELGINYVDYLRENEKGGFAKLPYKLYYVIMANVDPGQYDKTPPYGYIFPIAGYGLWDALYGLLALKPDANTILGVSWYDQKETPGLGAEISEAWWQKQFYNKEIFQKNEQGEVNYVSSPLGINLVRPGMIETLPSHKQSSAVNGVTGATATSNGVQNALKDTLSPYRPLLIKLHEQYGNPTRV